MVISPHGIVTIYSIDTEASVKLLPVEVTAARFVSKAPAACVKALKKSVTIVEFVDDVLVESVKAVPTWVTAVRFNGDVSPESVGALPAWVTRIVLVGNISAESVGALPAWVTRVVFVGDVPAESVGALPAWVTTVVLVGDVSEASIKAIPASVTTLRFWNNAPVATTETFYGLDVLAYAVAVRVNDEERRIIKSDLPPSKRRRINYEDQNKFTNYTASDFAPANPDTVFRQPISSSSFFYEPPQKPHEPFYPKQMTRG
jgi:hypothetical protein